MSTQISFTADSQLKEKALKKAKQEGISLKTLLVYAMKGFVDGRISFGLAAPSDDSGVEEIHFSSKEINTKAAKLARLLE